ncbi:5-hydroxytryptamine receptor 4-like [Protopterus annectens]|uniref:5-hydroxytryptamine receptor 4-like n=1 Tax=Protopterus annectens TaxID=7888 RepID=UPI001CF9FB62|nr:5-hydroxytryptamine receptor 4-like [Protopterus annectens]
MVTSKKSITDLCGSKVTSDHALNVVEKTILVIFFSFIIIMTVLGNLLVMVALCKDRKLRKKKTNYFVVSLAFADLLVAIVVMPFATIELVKGNWIYGDTFCLVRTSLDVMLTTASILHLCCIALDRYYAICCQPLVYRNKMTRLRVILMLTGCWVIPFFISFLPIMQGWNSIGIDHIIPLKLHQNKITNETNCVFLVNGPYAVTCSSIAFYVPLILMLVAYRHIYVTAREHARQIRKLHKAGSATETYESTYHQGSHRLKIETKAAKTLAVIMGCFCLCWAPFFITNVIDPFIDYQVPWQMWTTWLWLGYINSGLNPFLYAFLNKAFRHAFLVILYCGDSRNRESENVISLRTYSTSTNGSSAAIR